MKGGLRIGTIFNIPLYIDPSWFVILLLMTWSYSDNYRQLAPGSAWVFGLITALLLFGSVLLHELGHSLTAKAQGIAVNSITLFLFGGVASIERESKDPRSAFSVAIAGPLVSLLLGGLLVLLAWGVAGEGLFAATSGAADAGKSLARLLGSVGTHRALVGAIAWNLAQINLILGLFNLIPGLPLDGGQVLKAIVWKVTGNRFTGVRWAARSGQILGFLAVSFGLAIALRPGGFVVGLWPLLLGWFVMGNARAYLQFTRLQEALLQITVEEAMTRDFRIVDAGMTLRQFADEYLLLQDKEPPPAYYASDGRDRGLVNPDALRHIERSLWERTPIDEIVTPMQKVDGLPLKAPLKEAIDLLSAKESLRHLTIFSPVGSVAGVVDRGDAIRAIARKLNWPLPESFIQKIKAEGQFPPDFRLAEISAQLP